MSSSLRLGVAIAVVFAGNGTVIGQSKPVEPKTALFVLQTGSDSVGAALANDLRRAISRHPNYSLASEQRDAALLVQVVTVEAACAPGKNSSAAVALITNNRAQTLLDLRAITMTADMTSPMADRTLANMGGAVQQWLRATQ